MERKQTTIPMSLIFKNTIIEILFGSILLAFLITSFNEYLLIGIIIIITIIIWGFNFWQSNLNNNIISIIIIGFLTITSDLGETIRITVNLASILILFYVFFKKFALEFSKYPRLPGWMINFILLVIFSMLFSTIFSESISTGLIETSRQIVFFVIIYIMYSFMESEHSISLYIFSIIIAGGILSISIVYSFISSDKLMYLLATTGLVVDAGYFYNQAAAGGILAVSIPLTLALIVSRDRKFLHDKKVFLMFFIIEFISLLLTNSRAAISACIISLVAMTFMLNRKIFNKIIQRVIFVLFGLLLFFPSLINVFLTFFRVDRVLDNTRYVLWDMAFAMYIDHPIFGVGPGLFRDYMYKYLPVMLGTWQEGQLRWLYEVVGNGSGGGLPHNFFISKIAELGILGFMTALILPILFFYTGNKLVKRMRKENSNNFPLIVSIFCIGVGLFYRSFFEATGFLSYGWITRDLPFWLIFLILISFLKTFKIDNLENQNLESKFGSTANKKFIK